MRRTHSPDGHQQTAPKRALEGHARIVRPTASGMVTAGATILLLSVASVGLLIPSVFYLMPIPQGAEALTLCLPGIGPVQRFQEGLHPTQEELTFIHEAAHAAQCRSLGAAEYARQALTPQGRLRLESQALCAETAILASRGADGERLREWTIQALEEEYFSDGSVTQNEISEAVDRSCGTSMAE